MKELKKAFFVGPNSYKRTFWFFKILKIFDLETYRKKTLSKLKGNILDIGVADCGNYKFYDLNKISIITIIDYDEKMLNFAKEITKNNKFKFLKTDAMNLKKIPSNSIDYLVANFIYSCAITEPLVAFKEANRVLKKNGKLIIVSHIPSNLWYLKPIESIFDKIVDLVAGPENTKEVVKDIQYSGFKILKNNLPGRFGICREIIAVKK